MKIKYNIKKNRMPKVGDKVQFMRFELQEPFIHSSEKYSSVWCRPMNLQVGEHYIIQGVHESKIFVRIERPHKYYSNLLISIRHFDYDN